MMIYLACLLILVPASSDAFFRLHSPWGWSCTNSTCVKQSRDGLNEDDLMSLGGCKLTCGPYGVLWPKPVSATLGKQVVLVLPDNVILEKVVTFSEEVKEMTRLAYEIFLQNLRAEADVAKDATPFVGPYAKQIMSHKVLVSITAGVSPLHLALDTHENYSLTISTSPNQLLNQAHRNELQGGETHVNILAHNFFGARHALETLSQLFEYDERSDTLQVVISADIMDQPAFPYRGLILDTSRNFFPVEDIKRTLDAMAANKLNTFHWHITDTHSFPLFMESLPNMAYYGAYSSRQVYFPNDIRELVEYARLRGIRILPEFDAPAHVGNGWQWAEKQGLGKLAVCVNQEPWQSYCVEPPCGQLNVVEENMYKVLSGIYKEMAELFGPLDLFHFGGDEVNLKCWNSTEEIVMWMEANGYGREPDDFYRLWSEFQERAFNLFTSANRNNTITGVLWTSHLTEKGRTNKYLDKSKYIIQIWSTIKDELIPELLQNGYRVIFSNYDSWYLDCGVGAWVGEGNNWCSPYKGWQKVYDNNPLEITKNMVRVDTSLNEQILGGEAAMWSEQVDSTSLDSRVWPRGSALAERLWSNPNHNWESAEIRFIHHRQRLVQRGIKADRIQPQWCHQNEGLCYA